MSIRELQKLYRHGKCASLALAVSRQIGLPCVIFFSDDEDAIQIHAANAIDNHFVDVGGIVTHEELERYYGMRLKAFLDMDSTETLNQFGVAIGEYATGADLDGTKTAWKDCGKIIDHAINEYKKANSPSNSRFGISRLGETALIF